MKKILTSIAAAFICLCASAQDLPTGIIFGAGAGMNFGFDGLKYDDRSTSHNGAGWASDFWAGGWIGKHFGIRAGYQGFGISDRYTEFGNRKYTYAHGDIMFRPLKSLVPYLHAGYVEIVNPSLGCGLGIMAPIHLGDVVSIVPDVRATGYSSNAFNNLDGKFAMTISATLGLSIRIGPRQKKAKADITTDTTPAAVAVNNIEVVRDTVVIKETITEVRVDTVYVQTQEKVQEKLHETISAKALFDTDSSVLRDEAVEELDRIAEWLVKHPETSVFIEGHTDNKASAEYNQSLSERRALSVFTYLKEHGVEPGRMTYQGFGLDRPVAPNNTPEGRQLNRRVEIKAE